MNERPSWDDYFIKIAEDVKTRSTCIRRKVGAVIVKDKRILTTGYNGAPSGISHCTKENCLRTLFNIQSGERQGKSPRHTLLICTRPTGASSIAKDVRMLAH